MNKPKAAESYPPKPSSAGGRIASARPDAPTTGPNHADGPFEQTETPVDIKTRRVAEYAACQMLLDSLFSATSTSGRDLESVWIIACVLHNTLRNLVTDPHISARYLHKEEVPDHIYTSMSRRAIADKTGLSRETVRRRTNKLIEDGIFVEINGNVRLGYRGRSKEDVANINLLHAAASAFVNTVSDHNAHMPMDLPER